MRYHLVVLMLLLLLAALPLAVLPVKNVLAAPAPDPVGILDIGSPPNGWTAEQNLNEQIKFMTSIKILDRVCSDPEVRKLFLVVSVKDARPWLAKNLWVKPEKGDRLLRFAFRAGKRNEQVTIINAFLRANLFWDGSVGDIRKRSQGSTDTLVWNPQGGNIDSSVASNWYDRTIGRQLGDDDPGPGPSTPIVLSGTFSPTSNSPIAWHDPAFSKQAKKTIRGLHLKRYTVIKWAR